MPCSKICTLCFFIGALFFGACGVSKVSVDPTEATIIVNETIDLEAKLETPENVKDFIIWASSNRDVAVVSSTGKVYALKKGKVTIIAKASGHYKPRDAGIDYDYDRAECKITVKNPTYLTIINNTDTDIDFVEWDETQFGDDLVDDADTGEKEDGIAAHKKSKRRVPHGEHTLEYLSRLQKPLLLYP